MNKVTSGLSVMIQEEKEVVSITMVLAVLGRLSS